MTTPKLDQAREWARDNIDDFYEGERGYAVCEVIQSLPDQWIDPEGGLSTEYGALVSGFPTALADWQDWAEEPVNAMEWFSDRDERDDFGTHREDEGYEVEYFTRLVTSPIKDEMEHVQ